ncbi:MAG: helix-turn-helix transcriptional regulator [Clostridia bacterium]|nr:helix-turn-helix transcriptional regulator [Clostridia bacterium]
MNKEYDYISLGKRIRKIRTKKHLTQEQLAEACELSAAHIGHIERGTRALSIESLITISNVLDVSTDYLLLDVANNEDRRMSGVLNAVYNMDKEKFDKFYSVVKVLAENVDKLK